jgi:trans-aconitate methyltransferase
MAKFSQQFLQAMAQPSYQQGLFTAAQQLGGLQGRLEQERGAMQRFDESVRASEQGIAAAQQGDVSALTNRIAELRRQMASATTLQEKQRIRIEMANLQRLQPGAQKIAVGNKAQSIVQGEQALQDESLVGPARSAIEQRLEALKQDPEAMTEYNKFKMDQWRTDQAQREMQSQQWLADNSAEISKAIDNNDMDAVESIVQGAGEFSEAAQSFVATSLRNADAMARFEENSMERKIAPSVDYYKNQLETLPEEVRKILQPTFDAYKEASDNGWNGSEWTTGGRLRAKQLEKDMQSQFRSIYSQIATSEYFAKRREDTAKQEQIAELKLKIATPMSSEYVRQGRIQAASLLKEGEELTQAMIDREARSLYQMDQRRDIAQLAALRDKSPKEMPAEGDGGFSVKINDQIVTRTMVTDMVSEFGKEETKKFLKDDKGLTNNQIQALLGVDMSESQPTQEEMITEPGLINPFRARKKLEENLFQGLS